MTSVVFAQVSDAIWLAIIGLVTVFVNAITVIATMVVKELLDQRRATAVAVKVNEVEVAAVVAAKKVEEKLDNTTAEMKQELASAKEERKKAAEVGLATHDLCNSAMGEQKRMHAVKCRATANSDPTPANLAEADEADRVYADHQTKQAKVDQRQGGSPLTVATG